MNARWMPFFLMLTLPSFAVAESSNGELKKILAIQQARIEELSGKVAALQAGLEKNRSRMFQGSLSKAFVTEVKWQKIPFDVVSNSTLDGEFREGTLSVPLDGKYLVLVNGYSRSGGTAGERYALGVAVNDVLAGFSGGDVSAVDSPLATFGQMLALKKGDRLEARIFSAIPMTLGGNDGANGHRMHWHVVYLGE